MKNRIQMKKIQMMRIALKKIENELDLFCIFPVEDMTADEKDFVDNGLAALDHINFNKNISVANRSW